VKSLFPESGLNPHAVHPLLLLPVFDHTIAVLVFNRFESNVSEQLLDFFKGEIVSSSFIMADVEVLSKLLIASFGEAQLRHIVPAIVSKVDNTTRLHLVTELLHDVGILFRSDSRKNKQEEGELS